MSSTSSRGALVSHNLFKRSFTKPRATERELAITRMTAHHLLIQSNAIRVLPGPRQPNRTLSHWHHQTSNFLLFITARRPSAGKTRSDSYEATGELLGLTTANQASKIPSEPVICSGEGGQRTGTSAWTSIWKSVSGGERGCSPTRAFIVH